MGLLKEGWTAMVQGDLSNKNFIQVGRLLGLDECIVLHASARNTASDKTVATAVEAILGAVHKDGGDAALDEVMTQLGLQ